ncbi:MAG: 30S ribosomal protein S21 [Chloroflexota bacterium]|nr:30S ribosomal protein S21 [Chloroflexota bacterium]
MNREGGESRLTRVELRSGESQESLLRRFRKRVTRDRVLSDVKKKRFFVSRSEKRRRARLKAIRRERQRQRRKQRRYRR